MRVARPAGSFASRLPRIALLAGVVLPCVGCDQWTKGIAASRLLGPVLCRRRALRIALLGIAAATVVV